MDKLEAKMARAEKWAMAGMVFIILMQLLALYLLFTGRLGI